MNQILIGIAPEAHNRRKAELLRLSTQYDRTRLRSIQTASRSIRELLSIDPTNQEAIRIRDEISDILKDHIRNFYQWLAINEAAYYQRFDTEISPALYTKLYGYCMNLQTIDRFVQADEKQFCFLSAISDEYHNPGNVDFIYRCRACFNMP